MRQTTVSRENLKYIIPKWIIRLYSLLGELIIGVKRNPTSDEWEYAARGGLPNRRFPWGDNITHELANYYSSSWYSYDTSSTREYYHSYDVGKFPYTSPVGSFTSNGCGLHDISGNVWEWCWDELEPDRCLRGGSWSGGANNARCGWRDWDDPIGATNTDGFRTVYPAEDVRRAL